MAETLIVDDSKELTAIFSMIMQNKGMAVRTALTLAAAASMVEQRPPSLILLDVRMGDGDGRDLCKKLKNDPRYSGIKIILLSCDREMLENFEFYGADAIIPKPFDLQQMLNVMDSVMNGHIPAQAV